MANNDTRFSVSVELRSSAQAEYFFNVALQDQAREEGVRITVHSERDGETAYLYAEESGNDGFVAETLHAFLKKFRRKDEIVFGVAHLCSKPRPFEFGGAAWYVSAKKIEGVDAISAALKFKRKKG